MSKVPLIQEWKDVRAPELKTYDREQTIILLTCSPLEVHGPHLPMAADIIEGNALLQAAVERLHQRLPELRYLRLPPLYTATDVIPQQGSLSFRPSTIVRVLCDLGRSLSAQGFRHIWVSSFHGGPRHFLAIEEAAAKVNRRFGARMVPVFSLLFRRLTEGRNDLSEVLGHLEEIDKEHLDGDMHAGLIETSLLLHLVPELVDEHRGLEQRTIDLRLQEEGRQPVHQQAGLLGVLRQLSAGLRFFEDESYAGHPAEGSAEAGARILEVLSSEAAAALHQLWQGEIPPAEWHSPLWKARWLVGNRLIDRLFKWWHGHRTEVW